MGINSAQPLSARSGEGGREMGPSRQPGGCGVRWAEGSVPWVFWAILLRWSYGGY